ncbi:hypothetical protein [Flavobacterium sharifuzzamanii]|uniref:hypothetical protein n=1 Tax=Flavobacterium sharifuzzamanii TaxID=2211133 RepID=UPI000DABB05C|nr:hypothetical protein [Flavobacterium sharifuzzamanii]KAF2079429.1 hypothetical protein DMA14_17950 [Flavobacterium sharifuzzamanii]
MASTDKFQSRYLVFDDDDEAENQYKRSVKIDGYECIPIYINPSDFFDADKNEFKEEEFTTAIIEKTAGININLIVTDWNIIDSNENYKGLVGWDILEYVIKTKDKLKSKPFFVYSSDIKKASKYILSKISQEVCNGKDKIDDLSLNNFIADILQLKIKFWKRDGTHFNEIITLLRDSNTISNIVLDSILSFDQNMVINTGNINYDGKSINEILNGDNIDMKGLKFIREFIDLSIAHYSKLNE